MSDNDINNSGFERQDRRSLSVGFELEHDDTLTTGSSRKHLEKERQNKLREKQVAEALAAQKEINEIKKEFLQLAKNVQKSTILTDQQKGKMVKKIIKG